MDKEVLIDIKGLKKYYPIKNNFSFSNSNDYVKAVDNVNLQIRKGETFGLVGESGCGKSTLSKLITLLINPDKGEILFRGTNILKLKGKNLRNERRKIQMIFQNPYESLNPRMTVGEILASPFKIHKVAKGPELEKKVAKLLDMVGLSQTSINRYPHEFSGGQRQRIGIARAIALNPELIICDEAVSALDVSVQAQILNLLTDLQKEFNLTYLFISHDLSVVKHVSNRIGVMYLGKIVEISNSTGLYRNPKHPYTQALLSAIPIPDPEYNKKQLELTGEVPSPVNPPKGCRLSTRCPFAMPICHENEPKNTQLDSGHIVACHLYENLNTHGKEVATSL